MNTNQVDETALNHSLENGEQQENNNDKEEFSIFRAIQSVMAVAILIATLMTLWNPRNIFRTPDLYDLFQSGTIDSSAINGSENNSSTIRIGLLAGHWQNSTGEVCADGTIEADINYEITNRLKLSLEENGYQVTLFPEFDIGLLNYDADAFLAIYSGSCLNNPPPKSGFSIGTSLTAENQEIVNQFAVCLAENYQSITQLPFTYQVINPDHSSYHIFRDISQATPAIMIEIGSLSTDRNLIMNRSNTVVEGVAAGIKCFIDNDSESK